MTPIPTDRDAYVRFHSYLRGYKDGVCGNAKRTDYDNNAVAEIQSLYREGYDAGRTQILDVNAAAMLRFNYSPNPLRHA